MSPMAINSQAPFIKEREVMTDKEDGVGEERLSTRVRDDRWDFLGWTAPAQTPGPTLVGRASGRHGVIFS